MPKYRIVSTFTSLFKIPVFINRSREQNKCLFCAQSCFTSEEKPSSEVQLSARRHLVSLMKYVFYRTAWVFYLLRYTTNNTRIINNKTIYFYIWGYMLTSRISLVKWNNNNIFLLTATKFKVLAHRKTNSWYFGALFYGSENIDFTVQTYDQELIFAQHSLIKTNKYHLYYFKLLPNERPKLCITDMGL